MPSSYTNRLRLVLPVTGELTGSWGDVVNAGLTQLVEDAIAGTASITMSDANLTLSTANEAPDQARNMFITLNGGSLSAQRDVICPAVSKLYFVTNNTTGGQSIRFKTPSGTGVVVPPGQRAALYCDGVNVVAADTATTSAYQAADAGVTTALKTLPSAGANLVSGEVSVRTAGFTVNTGLVAGNVYPIYNNSASAITITQGSGVTLRLAGTTTTGNRTLSARGMASLWCLSASEYILSGVVVS